MSLKRRNTSSPESDEPLVSKRQRPALEEDSDESFEHPISSEQPRSDPTYGQKGAFPGLEDDDDELFYGPPSDGLEYLRMVRLVSECPSSSLLQAKISSTQILWSPTLILIAPVSYFRSEAKGVPNLLVAPRALLLARGLAEDGIHSEELNDKEGGYYADGAYTAAPNIDSLVSPDPDPPDAQDSYYQSLSARFKLLHATLKCNPPLSAIEALDSSTLISLPPDTESAQSQWRFHLQSSDPLMVQLACMDSESVLEVVKILTGTMAQIVRSRSRDKALRFGAWVWSVLGRCRDRTELGSEEIAVLRELGKRAVQLLLGSRNKTGRDSDARREAVERLGGSSDSGKQDAAESMLMGEPGPEVALDDCRGAYDTSTHKENVDPNRSASNDQNAAELEAAKRRLESTLLAQDNIQYPGGLAVNRDAGNALGINAAKDYLDVDPQIRIMLDMILTVVGEFYGQRDLLEFRDLWDEG